MYVKKMTLYRVGRRPKRSMAQPPEMRPRTWKVAKSDAHLHRGEQSQQQAVRGTVRRTRKRWTHMVRTLASTAYEPVVGDSLPNCWTKAGTPRRLPGSENSMPTMMALDCAIEESVRALESGGELEDGGERSHLRGEGGDDQEGDKARQCLLSVGRL